MNTYVLKKSAADKIHHMNENINICAKAKTKTKTKHKPNMKSKKDTKFMKNSAVPKEKYVPPKKYQVVGPRNRIRNREFQRFLDNSKFYTSNDKCQIEIDKKN